MDEAEKYQQRLEAIAEKRRLVEEQERVKREMEDERIRLQQLKRKSLRDQWLMEGPPLSPSSLDAPHSPLWGSQAQESEMNIDKLESESQRLVEDEEKLEEEMEESHTQKIVTVTVAEIDEEIVQDVVQNGKNAAESGEEIGNDSRQLDNVILTNGAGDNEDNISHNGSSVDVQSTTNGLIEEAQDVGIVNTLNNDDEEEEEGTMVIRAECVMITDEGDDTAEEKTKENSCIEENAPLFPEEEETQQTVTESVQIEKMAATADENTVTENSTEEEKVEIIPHVQLQSTAQEGAIVGSVPVYTETQPSNITSNGEVENEEANHTVEVSKPKESVTVEFQEVPLSEPQVKPREQEPLLSAAKAQETHKEPANPSFEAEIPNRADQAEIKAPKRKTCQCCSVM